MASPFLQLLSDTGDPTFELLNIQIGSDEFSEDLRRNRSGIKHQVHGITVASRTWKQARVWNLNINIASRDFIFSLRPFFEAGAFKLYPDGDDTGTSYNVFWENDSFDPVHVKPGYYSLKATFNESTVGAGIPTHIGGSQDQVVNGNLTVNGDIDITGLILSGGTDISTLWGGGGSSGDHNDTTNIQGGTANEYYHLTATEYAELDEVPASGVQSGLLSGAFTFNDSLVINGPSLNIDKADGGTGVISFCDGDSSLIYIKASSSFTATKDFNVMGDVQQNGSTLDTTYAPIAHSNNDAIHFTAQEHDDLLDLIYVQPTFTSFSVEGNSSTQTIEVGSSFGDGTMNFTWVTSESGNVEPNTVDIDDSISGNIVTNTANDGSYNSTYGPVSHNSETNRTWTISADNTQSSPVEFDRTLTVRWYWRYYWGSSASTTLNEAGIEGLQNDNLYSNENRTFACNANNYKWICYPTSEGIAGGFTDADTGFAVAMESPQTISVTNTNGITTNYYAYRTTNATAQILNITVG